MCAGNNHKNIIQNTDVCRKVLIKFQYRFFEMDGLYRLFKLNMNGLKLTCLLTILSECLDELITKICDNNTP
jgi:hypothetical protein